jgi:hypothetical protein
MGPIDAFWHLAAFLAPAVGIGVLSAAMAKLLWRRDLKVVAWRRLALWATVTAALVSLVGLLAFGRDGLMGTYSAMVLAAALALWWVGFVSPRR